MRDTIKFLIAAFRRKELYLWVFWLSLLSFAILLTLVTPSSYGWVPADWNAFISVLASLCASLFAGILVAAIIDAVLLERELGPMKKLFPFIDRLTRDSDGKLKMTVAALPVDLPGGDKAPGSGEAMAISHIVRLLMELGMSKTQIDLSYAEKNAGEDWREFQATPIDRIVLGGPKFCPVTKEFLQHASSVVQFEEDSDQWRIDFPGGNLRRTRPSDAGQGVDYGLILWHEAQDEGRWWIFLAGLGTHGVIAAGEAITTRQYVKQILERANGDFSNLAVLVKCTTRPGGEFIVDHLEVTEDFRFMEEKGAGRRSLG